MRWVTPIIIVTILMLVGIVILVVIKIVIYCLDYIQVKELEQEVANAQIGNIENPFFQPPTQTFVNPIHGEYSLAMV